MPKFLQGTSQLDTTGTETIFNGVTFTDAGDLLTKVRDTLTDVDAGWTIVEDDIAGSSTLKMQGVDNGHNCYVNFLAETISGNTIDLKIQGDIDGTGRTRNTDVTNTPGDERLVTQRVKAGQGRLYGVASARSFVFCSVEKTLDSIPLFGGFPNRKDNTDAGAWLIGDLHWRMSNKYLALAGYVNGDWYEIKDFFNSGNEADNFTSTMQGGYDGTMDSTVIINGASQTLAATQSAYKPEYGSLNPDGQAVIQPFYLRQGQFLQGDYAHIENEATAAPIIGEIDFAYTGLASLAAGDQVVVRSSKSVVVSGTTYTQYFKRTYIAGTAVGTRNGYQGFLIDEQTSDNPL